MLMYVLQKDMFSFKKYFSKLYYKVNSVNYLEENSFVNFKEIIINRTRCPSTTCKFS